MQIKTQAYIIKSYDWREHDRLFVLYTRDLGKIRARARGVKKISSKMSSFLQIFRLLEITLVKSRDLYVITGVNTQFTLKSVISDYHRARFIWALLGALDILFVEQEKNVVVFDGLSWCLNYINFSEDKEIYPLIFWGFIAKVVSVLGFLPQLNNCVECEGQGLEYKYFSIKKGGLLCDSCEKVIDSEHNYVCGINSRALSFLHLALSIELSVLVNNQIDVGNVDLLLSRFIEFYIGKKLPVSLIFS